MKKKSIFKKVKEGTLHFFSSGKKITICLFVLLNTVFFNAIAQKAEVTVTLKTVGITNYKYACTNCWELGKNEYTSSITAFPVTGPSSFSSGCLQCDQDGDCTYGQDVTLFTQTGKFDSIAFIWYNWENNVGDRCLYEHQYFDDDGCLGGGNGLYNFRTLSGPSDGIYTNSAKYTRYQWQNFPCKVSKVPFADVTLKSTWKYSGAQNLIVPSCTSGTTAFAASTIPSWTAQLYAGVSYSFNTCSSASGENTYIRIYGSNGYTKVAENDNGCGQAASLTFTPATDGYYYIEVSHADRSLTESTGILEYKINENGNQTCASALSIGTGSVKYFNTYCSTQDAPAQICSQSADEHKDVWFKYTPSSTGSLVINSTSNYDTRISVYSGACSSLTYLRCNTVGTYLGGPNILTLNVCKGTTYYISVGGTYGGTGAGRLSLSLTPGNTLPSITCPPNINLWNSPGVCSRIYDYTAPTGSDNCSGAVTTQIAGLPSGSTFPIGLTTNTFKVTDSDGATAVCSFTVFVRDNEYPVITCPPSVTINKCTAVSYYFPDPTVSDNCGSENVTIEQLAGLPSGSTFPLGVTTNTFRAIDGRPNASLHNCSFSITVTENAPLSITCPNNMVVDANPSDCYHTRVSYPIPRADGSTECGLQLSLIGGLITGSEFPFGITTVSWEVATTDGTYQTASCSFTVTVRDRRPPVITCPADISVSPLAGNCQATVNYTSPIKSDDCFGPTYPLLSQISGLTSGASFPIGTTTNIFKATDLSGNSATCSFSIHVADATPPSITCPDNIVNTLEPTECGDVIDFIAPVGTDNCSGAITVQTEGLPSGSYLSAGSATNTFVVTDAAGMSASCSFTISVSDLEPPAITCPDNISVDGTSSAIPCETIVFYTSPIGTDNCQGVITTRTTGLPSGSYFPEGETAVSFVATDAGGLNSSCSFTVTVGSCNQAPVAQCKNLTVSADALCQATISAENANDNSNDPDSDELTFSISPQGPYSLGEHIITFTAQDAAGLQDACTFILSVVDNSPPETPNLPEIQLGECSGTPPVPTTSDHCAGTVTGTTTTVFPIENQGTTVIIWTFDDGNGNSIDVPQNVIVDDITAPQIPVLSDLYLNPCQSLPEAPTTIDNCKGLVVGHTSSIFPILDPGHYNVIWNFDDGNGNSIDVSQNVIVEIPFVPGKYFNLNTCTLTPCPPGTYCPGGTTEPIYCPAGKYQGLEGQAVCIPCLAGTFSSETGSTFCTSCPAGKFQDLEGQDHCLSCPTGTYSDVTGSTVCTSCPAGKYQGLEGQDHCLSCPAGSYSDVTGSVVCKSCPAGQYQGQVGQDHCESCPAGTYSDVTGSIVCTSCPAGQYQGLEGQDHCETCGPGTYSNATGAVACTNCPPGKFSSSSGSTSCTECPAHTYNPNSGASECLNCPAGTYNPNTGAVICPDCILSISCASSNPVNTDAGSCTASSVNLIEPVVSNSCPLISLVSNAQLNYPVGSTVVTWIATDVSGVTATCQQTVTVKKFGDASLLYAYTILSNDEVKMKENIVESGGVGVITANKKVSLEKNSKIIATNTFVKSGNIDVKSGSAVTTKINGNVPSSLKPPFIENVNPGNNDVKINDNSAPVTLNLSNYGKIEVGKNVVATLSGHANVYIKELKLKEGSQLKFNQATHVMIDKKLDGDNNIKINDNAISRVQFYVEEEVKINKSSIVKANIYTKKEIKIENSTSTSRTYMTGQFIANKVDAGEYVTWNWDASYCPEEIQSLSSKNSNSKSMIEDVDSNFSKTSTKGGELLVYPNPAQNILFVKMNVHPHSRNQIEILNSLGEKISEQNYVSNYEDEMITKFDMSIYPNGLYFIRATMDGNKIIKSFSIHK